MRNDTVTLPKFGDVLPNGTTVVQYVAVRPGWGIVLAHRDHPRSPWITWSMDPERLDSTETGHYMETLQEAVADLHARAERHTA